MTTHILTKLFYYDYLNNILRCGLNKKDKFLKDKGYLSINDIKKLLNKGRATIETVIKYLYIEPTKIVGTHKFYKNDDFEKIKSFYAEHSDFEKFLAKEMRIRKYGENPYKNRDIKTKQTLIEKYGENYIEVLNHKRNDSMEEKYGNKNYRNIEQQKETLYKNRINFCKKNNCIIFSEIFGTRKEHSWETLEKCLNNCEIKLINYKTVLYIKNDDIEKLQNELNKINYYNTSTLEKEITDFIKLEYVENDRTILNGQELDIYVPSKKLAIEFDGLYLHSSLFKNKDYHINKTIETEKQEIKLLHIFEDDWLYKKEICKSIIKNNLKIYSKIINANDCKIIKINKTTFKNFCEENYISDFYKIKTTYGLFYNDNLIYVFNVKINKDNFIIYDFVSKLNIKVFNSLNHFINRINKTCILYADRRFYNQNDFNCYSKIEYTSPRKFYIKNRKRYNFISNSNTIYDCGLLKITFSKI